MKKTILAGGIAAVLSLAVLSGCGESDSSTTVTGAKEVKKEVVDAKFQKGIHFETLVTPIDRPTDHAMEVFSFACPHCYTTEKELMKDWKASLEESKAYELELVHSGYQKWFKDAQVFYTLKAMKRTDVYPAYFDARQTGKIVNDETFYAFLEANKVRKKPYDAIAESNNIKKAIEEAGALEQSANLNGVPSFVVSGKYKIKLEGIKGYTDIRDITEYLIKTQP